MRFDSELAEVRTKLREAEAQSKKSSHYFDWLETVAAAQAAHNAASTGAGKIIESGQNDLSNKTSSLQSQIRALQQNANADRQKCESTMRERFDTPEWLNYAFGCMGCLTVIYLPAFVLNPLIHGGLNPLVALLFWIGIPVGVWQVSRLIAYSAYLTKVSTAKAQIEHINRKVASDIQPLLKAVESAKRQHQRLGDALTQVQREEYL